VSGIRNSWELQVSLADNFQAYEHKMRLFRAPDPNVVIDCPSDVEGNLISKFCLFQKSIVFIELF